MLDKQATAVLPSGRIPVISPVLHCLSMPVLVFWRKKFGYAYLSPKSVFFSVIFASCLFSYMVWNDPALKPRFIAVALFGSVASALYVIHLIACVGSDVGGSSEHDQYSGWSRLLDVLPRERRNKAEGVVHGFVEPTLTVLLGIAFHRDVLGGFLQISGAALGLKELIRYWLGLRGEKRVADSMDQARDFSGASRSEKKPTLSGAGRTDQEVHVRHYEKDSQEEARYAEILRMLPPYTLQDAETNASKLVEALDSESAGSKEKMRRIEEALDYFRGWQE